jgi:glycosyltransferase involved in cell wall biosynthesis
MLNAIDPIPFAEKATDKINLIYHTTPHRGLNILLSIYDNIVKKHPNVHLDVYSSFKLYGWEERDIQFKPLFDYCKEHENITYHGSVSNDEVRQALQKAHIFAYPSIWEETSCLSLIEAMSAGVMTVHPDLGALAETAANWTNMYRWTERIEEHAKLFFSLLDVTINEMNNENIKNKLLSQKSYTDVFFNWQTRKLQWEALLVGLIKMNEPKEIPGAMFTYRA